MSESPCRIEFCNVSFSYDDRLCLVNTKFLVLRDGRVIFDGTDEQLWASEDPFIRSFLLIDEQAALAG